MATLIAAAAIAAGACTGAGSTAAPTDTPFVVPTPGATTGPWTFRSTIFDRPFTATLPEGWVLGEQTGDMSSLYRPYGTHASPIVGIDVQEVGTVFKDPCDNAQGNAAIGPSAQDLADWMTSWAPLRATTPTHATLAGFDALVVDEAFAGVPCANANMWAPSGGWLDPAERKRYYILEVRGKRIVVTLVERDDTWQAYLPEGQAVLATLAFAAN